LGQSDVPTTTGPGGWTIPRLVAALAPLGDQVSARTVRRRVRRLKARWRRGQIVAKGDPARAAVWQRLAEDVLAAHLAAVAAGRRLVIVFEDEADLALLAHAGDSWQLPGHPATIPSPGQNEKVGVFGSLSWDGALVGTEAARKTAVALTAHLDAVVARFPDAELAVIMANVGIHHAKATKAWWADHPRVHQCFLPRYSPNDNAQERVGGWVRADVCRNRAYPDWATKRAAARTFLAARTPAALCQRCVPARLLTNLLAAAFGSRRVRCLRARPSPRPPPWCARGTRRPRRTATASAASPTCQKTWGHSLSRR
jgi:hypothetical protein